MAGRRGRGRPRTEDKLMDDAIRLFESMGYAEDDIRSTVQQLVEMYGKRGMWLLKEDNYSVVQDALFEKQEQEERRQRLLVQEEPNKQKESAISEAPVKSYMQMVEMHDEISAVESSNDPMLIDRPTSEATLPRPAATGTIRARRPCYGWISESESDSDYEEYLASRQHEVA
ncbi:uncharacterized protein [Lolium perenne]|uniref:uncharacterized protein n=1 Tax=Lolium perenne TaxID=4522 RepID=UPI0021F54A05|nr:uncharacterized protein LOC127300291 [Lolium perenne]XP_051186346.1 uncharacterized protein LOC127300291 [Lolium perenne]